MRGRSVFALVLAGVWQVGCGKAFAPPSPPTLTVAVRADVTGIFPNPPYQPEAFTIDVNGNVFDSLVRFDRELRILPALADSWENPDELSWVFHLRRDLRFSNGERVHASDVVASLRNANTRRMTVHPTLLAGDSIEALGQDRILIRTRLPAPLLLAHLQANFVLPEKALAVAPVPAIGSGPYRLTHWKPGRELLLERNPFFHGAAPGFERVRVVVMPNGIDRINALLSGQAQVADSIPPEEIERLEREPSVRVISEPSLRVLFLAFRVDRPPFSDIRVRRAIRLGIDQRELVKIVLHGHASPATQLVPPPVVGYNPEISETAADVARARQLLAEAGYARGFDTQLDGPSDRYVNDAQILEEVRRQLARVGVRLVVNTMPKSRYFPYLKTEASAFYLLGWMCNSVFGGDALDGLIRTRGSGAHDNFNYQGIAEPEFDALAAESMQSPDPAVRASTLRRAMAVIAEKELVVPLLIPHETIALSRDIAWNPEKGLSLRFANMLPASASRQLTGSESSSTGKRASDTRD